MSLKQNLSYRDYQYSLSLTRDQCDVIAGLADIELSYTDNKKPGDTLIKNLDRKGLSVEQYKQLLAIALRTKTILTYYKPQSKVAILIANEKYEFLSKLVTPSIDCESLGSNLRNLGFITVTIRNTTSEVLKRNISKVIELIPEDSYYCLYRK